MQHITHDNEIEINGYQSQCLFRQSINEIKQFNISDLFDLRRVWRYQRGNQNPYIEEQTT